MYSPNPLSMAGLTGSENPSEEASEQVEDTSKTSLATTAPQVVDAPPPNMQDTDVFLDTMEKYFMYFEGPQVLLSEVEQTAFRQEWARRVEQAAKKDKEAVQKLNASTLTELGVDLKQAPDAPSNPAMVLEALEKMPINYDVRARAASYHAALAGVGGISPWFIVAAAALGLYLISQLEK